jgi:hypothetical protein
MLSGALAGDFRFAMRMIRRAPMFAATVVLTVTIAIAANATIFTVVNAVMIRSLPFLQPERIMQVAEKNEKLDLPTFGASALNFLSCPDIRKARRHGFWSGHGEWRGRSGTADRKSHQSGAD